MHGPIYDISTLAFSYMACLLIHVYSRQYMPVNDSYQFMNMITMVLSNIGTHYCLKSFRMYIHIRHG